ncbi:hypothetical protein DUI87_29075 [Hirundo rustica rustica]|uniref:Uncharacterized protein n=1 Tax=Hirundo rustica rustica TaxID=333673 RepID=A0A3M0J0C5_HIRRU|nr:hypothetical protein DUI87_29075 [Hirundo rustica rustica]
MLWRAEQQGKEEEEEEVEEVEVESFPGPPQECVYSLTQQILLPNGIISSSLCHFILPLPSWDWAPPASALSHLLAAYEIGMSIADRTLYDYGAVMGQLEKARLLG